MQGVYPCKNTRIMTKKGGAGGLPLQKRIKVAKKGGAGGLPLQKRIKIALFGRTNIFLNHRVYPGGARKILGGGSARCISGLYRIPNFPISVTYRFWSFEPKMAQKLPKMRCYGAFMELETRNYLSASSASQKHHFFLLGPKDVSVTSNFRCFQYQKPVTSRNLVTPFARSPPFDTPGVDVLLCNIL